METMNFLCKGRTGFFPMASTSSRFQSQRVTPDPNAMDIGTVNESWDESEDEEHIDAFSKGKAKCFTRCFNCGADGHLGKIVLDHRPNVRNAIGLKEIIRRLALNPGRSEQPRKKPLKIREKTKQLE